MTLFGIDVSNHQGNFDFGRARGEGFAFATHKITEGTWRDPYWPRARAEMATHFTNRWGGYVFCKVGTNPDVEADALLAHAGGTDFPLQIDYEDLARNGNISDLLTRVKAFQERGFQLLPIYLPRWYWRDRMGSPNLAGLPVPIWNSHYVTGNGTASGLYPGDGHAGWADMGGKPVSILQFSETASVAGQAIDVNAFRGSEADLDATFGAHDGGLPMAEASEILRQATGSTVPGEFPGWESRRYHETDRDRSKFTQTDYLREIDAKTASRLSLDNRPVDPTARDDHFGHTLSLRAEVAQLKKTIDAIAKKIGA